MRYSTGRMGHLHCHVSSVFFTVKIANTKHSCIFCPFQPSWTITMISKIKTNLKIERTLKIKTTSKMKMSSKMRMTSKVRRPTKMKTTYQMKKKNKNRIFLKNEDQSKNTSQPAGIVVFNQ